MQKDQSQITIFTVSYKKGTLTFQICNDYNFIMQSRQREWNNFIQQIHKSQQVVGQLSKLYIILHEHVRQTILKCTLDLNYNPTKDAHTHINKIMSLLQRLSDPNDTYLTGIDRSIIGKYQQQLLDLAEQVQKVLQTHQKVKNIDPKKLEGIAHSNGKEEFGLKDQLKRSDQRRLRSRSGIRRQSASKIEVKEQNQIYSLTSRQKQTQSPNIIQQFQAYKYEYIKKKQNLHKQMQGHIEKRDNQVIFSNKYLGSNLEDYFVMRRDLLDLVMVDQYTRQIVGNAGGVSEDVKDSAGQRENVENKLFGQFRIKTKFMKNHVRQNILQALADVKMQLLQDYHDSNKKKLNEGNPDTLIGLVPKKKILSVRSLPKERVGQSASTTTLHHRSHSNKGAQKFKQSTTRYPMAHKSNRPLVYQSGWSQQIQSDQKKMMESKLLTSRVPNSPVR